jgi:hypothetical protein
MDPTVTAAAIGVGGTVAVGVAGFSAAIWNTRRTFANARESRMWEKRAAAYEAALAELAQRNVARERFFLQMSSASPPTDVLTEYLAVQDAPGWFAAEGQLLAYSSEGILDALDTARSADYEASEHFRVLQEAVKASQQLPTASSESVREAHNKRTKDALMKAVGEVAQVGLIEQELIDQIRTELRRARGRDAS